MKKLKIQEYLKKHGLEKTVKDFSLKTREYPSKILLKYDQLMSPTFMALPEVQECRGLILEKNTWKVMSLAFKKFFNAEEGNAAKIDWDTAHILEKLDGSMVQVYWDWYEEKWFAATTGTAEGEGEVNNKNGTTFNDLFWETVNNKYTFNECLLNKDLIYVFELTTPQNLVVVPHTESSATLLTVRNRDSLNELSWKDLEMVSVSLGVPLVKKYSLRTKNVGTLIKTFENMSWQNEGYVVVDNNFNRVKVKNPAYVQMHHLKGKTAQHNIIEIIKSNEVEEFISTFKEREEEILKLKLGYDNLLNLLIKTWEELTPFKPKNISHSEKKKFSEMVFIISEKNGVKQFSNLFFGLNDGKINSVNEYLINFDSKKLYKML
jgi:hypothetical protein